MSRVVFAAFACWLVAAAPVGAQVVLTLEETIARAREQAGAVVVARARIAEAEAAGLDASARFRDNPVIEGGAGPRVGEDGRRTEIEFGISQQFQSGGQRQARIAGARAGVDRQRAEVRQIARDAVSEAASTFLEGIAAMERLQVAEGADAIARELLNASERRFALGDIAAIEVNLARIDAARSTAALVAARADLTAAAGRLRALLRIPASEPIELRGTLQLPSAPPIERLEASVAQRPEFAVLAAELREAEAQVQLGRALAKPDLGIRVGYEREEGNTILLGGLTVTIPAFQQGQGTRVAGLARANRVRAESDVARARAIADLRAAYNVYEQRVAVAIALEKDAIPSLLDNETLARRSYDAGEMNLMDLLLMRRDAVETRLSLIDRRLEAAQSRLSVDIIAGVIQ